MCGKPIISLTQREGPHTQTYLLSWQFTLIQVIKLLSTFSTFLSSYSRFSFFLPNEKLFRLISVRVDGPLLKKNDSKHTNEQKTSEVCFYPFFGEVVSLEQILGGSKVSACLLPTHLLALLLLLPGCLQGLKLVKLQLFKAQQASNTHMHTLPPLTTPLIDYQPATWIAFCS